MKKSLLGKSSVPMLILALLVCGVWPTSALAYVDPGTGSFVIQGIIAAIVGAGFALKVYWKRIVAAITGKSADLDDDLDDDDDL